MVIDTVAGSFEQLETTDTFTGTLDGVGQGTLTFVTTIPETANGADIVQSGTVGDGTGALAGYEGTIEMRFVTDADGQSVGTYTVTLERAP